MAHRVLKPKLLTSLQNYSKDLFLSDVTAGVIVGIVALPLAIAFAIASGVSPDKGLVTAVVAGFLISALGGSRVQIGGPTGAFVVIVYGIVQKYGVDGLCFATILAGIILLVIGFAGFGAAIKYIPYPVIVGFTSGIAVVIFSSQMNDFWGFALESVPADFLEKWKLYLTHAASLNWYSVGIALSTILLIGFWPKISRKVPGSVIALFVCSFAVYWFNFPVETIGSRFGHLPASLPMPRLPHFDFALFPELLKAAFAIAMLGGIESLLSAEVSDGMIGAKHRSNMELIAQGFANIASALFGGIPATGAIARTVTNVKNGGKTPVAGIVHAFTLLLILFFFGEWATHIPLACLAGILIVVAYHMSEWRSFRFVLSGPRSGAIVLVLTFFLTVLFDLTVAIEAGVVLSAFLFMHRMARFTGVRVISDDEETEHDDGVSKIRIPAGIEVFEIHGPLFFGASHKFEEADRIVSKKPTVRILRLRNVPIVDATGLYSLKSFHEKCRHSDIALIISGIHAQPLNVMKRSGLYEAIGEKNIFTNFREALHYAGQLLASK